MRGYTLNQRRFGRNAHELEAALALARKATAAVLTSDEGCGLVDGSAAPLGSLEQSVFSGPAYPTIEAKAAHLLYFVIRDHPFGAGNKRIASFRLVEFLHRDGRLLRGAGVTGGRICAQGQGRVGLPDDGDACGEAA